jgi:hypothetical protein
MKTLTIGSYRMPLHASVASTSPARIEALKSKHHKLSKKIEAGQAHYQMSDEEIRKLKLEKLHVKEEIEGIRKAS